MNPTSTAQITISFLKGKFKLIKNLKDLIFLKTEHHNSLNHHRDKFLILWMQVEPKTNISDLAEIWKTQPKSNINEHK